MIDIVREIQAVQRKVDTGKLPLAAVGTLRRLRHDPEAMKEAVILKLPLAAVFR